MVINVFGNPARQPSAPKAVKRGRERSNSLPRRASWYVKVNGEVVGTFLTRIAAEKFATRQRRTHKKRGAVKVIKR